MTKDILRQFVIAHYEEDSSRTRKELEEALKIFYLTNLSQRQIAIEIAKCREDSSECSSSWYDLYYNVHQHKRNIFYGPWLNEVISDDNGMHDAVCDIFDEVFTGMYL